MNTNVEDLLNLMEEELENSGSIPLSGKRMVDVDRIRDIIDEVRAALPDELAESRRITADREKIVKDARMEAEDIIQQAETRARAIVGEQEIVKRARQQAAEIMTAAQNQAKELTRSATLYCENILKKSEETLTRSVSDMKAARMNLRGAASHKRIK